MDYDFNMNNTTGTKIEEQIMVQLANDLGEPVLPHVAHIIISEFRKFMFLVFEHNKLLEERKNRKIVLA